MKTLLALAMLVVTSQAQADGFVCSAVNTPLEIKMFNHVSPEDGTRVGAIMVLSDPTVGYGRKTIARFTSANGVLDNKGAVYTANVDLRFTDSNRKGELIAGTKLGELANIEVSVNYLYGNSVPEGTELPGVAWLIKRDGNTIRLELDCVRYLKN